MYKFEKLSVWIEVMSLAEKCYIIAKKYPIFEKSGLSDQLRRASSSIIFNIAEGSAAGGDKEFSHFLLISRKSLFETISILKFSERVYPEVKLENVFLQCKTVGKLLNGLIKN
jgi:four helix bundle protein